MRAFPIRADSDLERALQLIEELWDADPGTEQGDLLEVMTALVEAYEAEHHPMTPGDPMEIISFKLKELDWSQRELGRQLGWRSTGRVSEILNRRRPLTLDMVQQLSQVLGIRPGLLVHDVNEGPTDGGAWVRLNAGCAHRVREECQKDGEALSEWVSKVVERECVVRTSRASTMEVLTIFATKAVSGVHASSCAWDAFTLFSDPPLSTHLRICGLSGNDDVAGLAPIAQPSTSNRQTRAADGGVSIFSLCAAEA